ncbi:ribosome assembly cofactor RimP [Salibacteraceae bacterium]|nr:ribosome assembly cofactor RimP [Crocinitomicaceae bacterium]MDB9724776.1 ribosome assembly cofactor RimP [Salibacteraceae bacterium]
MITKEKIESLIEEKLVGTDFFVVSIDISTANKISVEMDGDNGFPISECINFSRQIEKSFDREVEDFSLEVSSPGLNKPFRLTRQYLKNLNKPVVVKINEGDKVKGVLTFADDNKISVQTSRKERLEKKKKKVEIVEDVEILREDILETKLVIEF